MAKNHSFEMFSKIKYMGNKGVVVFASPNAVKVSLVGPFLFGEHTFSINSPEFKQLKKG